MHSTSGTHHSRSEKQGLVYKLLLRWVGVVRSSSAHEPVNLRILRRTHSVNADSPLSDSSCMEYLKASREGYLIVVSVITRDK